LIESLHTALSDTTGDIETSAERVAASARMAFTVAGAVLESPQGVWIISGGPPERQLSTSLHTQFRALAMEAAVLAGVAPSGSDGGLAVSAWLDLLDEGPFSQEYGEGRGIIENLPEASAVLCGELRARDRLKGVESRFQTANFGRADARESGSELKSLRERATTGASVNKSNNAGLVDAYIEEVAAAGRSITRKAIWSIWYESATEFQRWQRNDPRTTEKARQRFESVLRDKPHLPNRGG